ncbi:MAG: hypothetical protein R3A10_11240 [Caldilineaceae bacterium]
MEQNLRLSNVDHAEFHRWLTWFDLGGLDLNALARELPLETLRMVDLARAVARHPGPSCCWTRSPALTADQAERVFELLREWTGRGRSAVLITHRLAEVARATGRPFCATDATWPCWRRPR